MERERGAAGAKPSATGEKLGKQTSKAVATIGTADTILAWHRMCIAQQFDVSTREQSSGYGPCPALALVQPRSKRKGPMPCRERLGGLLPYYEYEAACVF